MALVSQISELPSQEPKIEIISSVPSRYSSYTADAKCFERHQAYTITRVKVPSHKNDMIGQSIAFLFYSVRVLKLSMTRDYDLVYASSSRLMTAVLATLIAFIKNAKLYIDFRDIFLDTLKGVLPSLMFFFLRPIFSALERITVHKADKINLVSYGFYDYFIRRYPNKKFSFFSNGVDEEFVSNFQNQHTDKKNQKLEVLYAGNIGEGQALHKIIPALAKHFSVSMNFTIIGDGGQKHILEQELKKQRIENVFLLKPVPRETLIDFYQRADVLWLHLNEQDAFRKVLPSKIFEYAASGKPIWAGVGGFAADFIGKEVSNAAIFEPCNFEKAAFSFSTLKIKWSDRKEFIAKYNRKKILKNMAIDIVGTLEK